MNVTAQEWVNGVWTLALTISTAALLSSCGNQVESRQVSVKTIKIDGFNEVSFQVSSDIRI